jgi:hypothetical protein
VRQGEMPKAIPPVRLALRTVSCNNHSTAIFTFGVSIHNLVCSLLSVCFSSLDHRTKRTPNPSSAVYEFR